MVLEVPLMAVVKTWIKNGAGSSSYDCDMDQEWCWKFLLWLLLRHGSRMVLEVPLMTVVKTWIKNGAGSSSYDCC